MNRRLSVLGLSLLAATGLLASSTRSVHAFEVVGPIVAQPPIVVTPRLPPMVEIPGRLTGILEQNVINPQQQFFIGPSGLDGMWWAEAGHAAASGAVEGAVGGAVGGAMACGAQGAVAGAAGGTVAGAASGFATYAWNTLSGGMPGMPGPIVINPAMRLN